MNQEQAKEMIALLNAIMLLLIEQKKILQQIDRNQSNPDKLYLVLLDQLLVLKRIADNQPNPRDCAWR